MLAELRPKAQITIPKSIITSMKLNTGDKLDVFERDGMICITPVVVYSKNYVDELHSEVQTIKADIEAGRKPVFNNIESLFSSLEQ